VLVGRADFVTIAVKLSALHNHELSLRCHLLKIHFVLHGAYEQHFDLGFVINMYAISDGGNSGGGGGGGGGSRRRKLVVDDVPVQQFLLYA